MALSKEKILAELKASERDHWLISCFDKLDSTNKWLMEQSAQIDIHGHVCLTDSQTAGVGRSGKQWLATDKQNILMSVAYKFELELAKLSSLSLITGIALVNVLEQLGISNLAIKWPNDIYLADAKLAGILIQTQKHTGAGYLAVIGIGLNIELNDQTKQSIPQSVADLSAYGLTAKDRELVIAKILAQLRICFNQFAQTGFDSFIKRWNQVDYLKNQEIVLYQANQQIKGSYVGINDDGALVIELPDQQKKAYYFGELSVRRESSL